MSAWPPAWPAHCSRRSAAPRSCACTMWPRRAMRCWCCTRSTTRLFQLPMNNDAENTSVPMACAAGWAKRRSRRSLVMHLGYAAGKVLAGGAAACLPASRRGADRQGHAHLRLHARVRAAGRFVGRRGGHLSERSDADTGGRLSDARAAAAGRHRDQRFAQSVRGQRHQVLLRERRQAARRGRAGDRGAAG